MPKQTTKYRLGYYAEGERTDGVTEARRFVTLDAQLTGLYEVLGNGVLSGFEVTQNADDVFAVDVSSGDGVIAFVSVKSEDADTIGPLMPSTTNYIYAYLTSTSYWTRLVTFGISLSDTPPSNAIILASAVTDETGITSIDSSVRNQIGLLSSIQDDIAAHRHIGGTSSPDLIDLSSEVQSQLSQENMPDLNASKVTQGVFDPDRIPKVDHIEGLEHQGTLTHSQLDAFVQDLSTTGRTLMGETSLVNLLQLILSLKHQWPAVDEFLVNEITMIPGITPDSFIDFDNTTAEVDTRTYEEGGEHTISGSEAPAFEVSTKTWNTPVEFEEAEKVQTVADSDLIRLQSTESSVNLDDFEEIGDWEIQIADLSSNSGLIELDTADKVSGESSFQVGANVDGSQNLAFEMKKSFEAQDWSIYDRLVFYLRTSTLEHGDIHVFISDATFGIQNSYTLVLERNAPSINRDTALEGWRELTVDLTPFQRSSITTVGLFMSTQTGWDASKEFVMNVDRMRLTSGNSFLDDGYSRFTFGNGTPQDFWRVRWDSSVPSGSVLKSRTRVSNSLSDFEPDSPTQATWSSYSSTSGYTVAKPDDSLYGYIQIEVFMEASSNNKLSPELFRLYLDSRTSASETTFVFDSQDEWESGELFDIDTTTTPGSIRIASVDEVDNVYYGTVGEAVQADDELTDIYNIAGQSLPITTNQVLNGSAPGLGQASSVRRGSEGTIWIADTDNDRVVQVDKAGSLLFGLYGSFLSEPIDPYGTEETGPGSNTDVGVETSAFIPSTAAPTLLHAVYNPETWTLYAVFDNPLEKIHEEATTFDPNKIFMKAASHRVYFGSSTEFSLFGIDPDKYDQWVFSTNPFRVQFEFSSHILQAKLTQADAAALNSIADFFTPSIVVTAPKAGEVVLSDSQDVTFSTPNFDLGGESTDNNGIRVRVDFGAYEYIRTRKISLTSLSDGEHTVEAALVDGNNTPLSNPEASVEFTFITESSGSFSDPAIKITSPSPGQTISSSTVLVAFEAMNHPILPVGSHVQYNVDDGVWIDYYSEDAIEIVNMSRGEHTVEIMLVDENGDEIVALHSRVTVEFNVGISSTVDLRLMVDSGAIRGEDRSDASRSVESNVSVDVGNISFANLYAPVDAEVVPGETSLINPDGAQTVLVAKLRAPSSTYGLAEVNDNEGTDTIFGTNYLDGHSVAQYDLSGNLIFTNNAAKFAETKATAKSFLGGAHKIDSDEVMIADAIRQRAIIVHTDLQTQDPRIIWEYESDRLISDFQMVAQEERAISVTDSEADPDEISVRTGTTVVWHNDSSAPITIYSGKTTPATFAEDPDLSLYGDEFFSQELQPGEQYAKSFDSVEEVAWFAYPSIVTGLVNVTASRISASDQYLILEKDPKGSVFGSRVIRVDSWGNVIWTFGEGVLFDPKDVRPLEGNSVIIST
jgi:hypothetical protein